MTRIRVPKMKFINFIFVSDFLNIPNILVSIEGSTRERDRGFLFYYLSIWIKNDWKTFSRVQLGHGLKMTRILFENFFSIDLCVHEPFITLFSSPMMRMISCTTVEYVEKSFRSRESARLCIYVYIYISKMKLSQITLSRRRL